MPEVVSSGDLGWSFSIAEITLIKHTKVTVSLLDMCLTNDGNHATLHLTILTLWGHLVPVQYSFLCTIATLQLQGTYYLILGL